MLRQSFKVTPALLRVVVGPDYPTCLYSSSPKWHVDYTLLTEDGEQLHMRRTFDTETDADTFAGSLKA
jgi:hypothetical protein